ncbi:MAG: DUF167 domain-containing protein [Myxococcales bacterium]|nr:DUF167 domain-containing protein [Myxococcales bacterium]
MSSLLRPAPEGALLQARVTPKASADRLGPLHDDRLKIAVTSPPDKGKANEHVARLLAKKLDLPKSAVEVVAGATDRAKTLLIRGLSVEQVRDKLGL